MEPLFFLQIAVSVIFFGNKVLVLVNKKSGWFVGAIAAILGLFYFYSIDLYIFTVLEVGLIVLMGYGAFPEKWKNAKLEKMIYAVIALSMLSFTYFAFSGRLTVYEFISSVGLIWGTYLLTHQKARFGWSIYCIAHAFAAYVGYSKGGQEFFATLQVASAIVSLVGMLITKPENNGKPS